MKALYFPFIPRDHQVQKDQRGGRVTITGASVYAAEFFEAIIKHSAYQRIYMPAHLKVPHDYLVTSELLSATGDRIRFLAEHQLPEMKNEEHLILVSPYQNFSDLVRIRKLCQRPHTPITGTIHSINYARQMVGMLELFMSSLHSFDALICSSTTGQQAITNFQDRMRQRFARAGLNELRTRIRTPTIPLGIKSSDFASTVAEGLRAKLSLPRGASVLLYFGRFSHTSKADLFPLLIIFTELLQSHPHSVLLLAGDDTHHHLAGELEEFARDIGCGNHVRVVPNPTFSEKRELYAIADIFVSLSDNLQETFGITIVEAMAAGLPVVASDWNGYKDIVRPGATGYLIPTFMPEYPARFDDIRGSGTMLAPDLLAATTVVDTRVLRAILDKLLADRNHRLSLGEAGRQRVRALYDWKQVMRQYEALWQELQDEARFSKPNVVEHQLDLSTWGYKQIFGHYASSLINTDIRLRLSKLGQDWRCHSTIIAKIAPTESWFRLGELHRILILLESTSEVSVRELICEGTRDCVRGQDYDLCLIRFLGHLCRLIKYDFIEIVRDFEAMSPAQIPIPRRATHSPFQE